MITYIQMHRGEFLRRPNRFLADVLVDGQEVVCHVKNTGRCRELLVPGAEVWCQHHDKLGRKTAWSLITVRKGLKLVNIDSQVPNRLAQQWVACGGLGFVPEMIRAEQTHGDSRFDLYFECDGKPCYLEVKGVTLEQNGIARFPDAPTERGTKHLRGLIRAASEGFGAYVLFVVQMEGVDHLEPNWATDPVFSQALCDCADAGVQILAVSCHVTVDAIEIRQPISVKLGQPVAQA